MFSYAQNFEDVMLARCFSNQTSGFYIDVGANDPVVDSVTKHFYDLGWCGINVEPMEHYFQKICSERPRDINLNCAACSYDGEINFYEIENTGLSSVVEASSVNAQHRGFKSKKLTVVARKLDSIILEHNITSIDFLKVDVEGFEGDVLAGFNFTIRPKIIVIEINKPLETNIQDLDWEPKLLENGYVKAYYDGLNNFYVDINYVELFTPCLAVPPNVFDFDDLVIATGYIRSEIARLHQECANRDNAIHSLNSNLAQVNHELAQVNHNIVDVNNQLRNEKNEVNRLHQECANRDNAIHTLNDNLAQVNHDVVDVNNQLLNEKNEVNRLHQECAIRDNEVNRLHQECAIRDNEVNRLHSEIHLRNNEIYRLNINTNAMSNTISWKITKPLRLLKKGVKKIIYMPRQLVSRTKRLVKRVIIKVAKKIATINIIKRVGKSYLNKHPELKMKIKQKMIEKSLLHNPHLSLATLSPKIDMATDDAVEQVRQQYGNDVANVYQILTKKK